MSNGMPPNTLKARLSKQMEAEINYVEDLMSGQFQDFESNLMQSLTRVQNTIESDISNHLKSMSAKIRRYEDWKRPTPRWLIACLMMGAISLSAWGMVVINQQTATNRFERMGIYLNTAGEIPILIIDPKRLKIVNCTLSGNAYYCLTPKEE